MSKHPSYDQKPELQWLERLIDALLGHFVALCKGVFRLIFK